MLRENALHSLQKRETFWNFWQRPEVTGHYKKIPPLYLRKKFLATARNLKVNEQFNYDSVPLIFLFPAIEVKPEYVIIEVLSLQHKSEITP